MRIVHLLLFVASVCGSECVTVYCVPSFAVNVVFARAQCVLYMCFACK
jgi:hypothetical protein